eukprot:comp23557_c0_seq1/m.39786 comp23557_c0_seq1/g.39786  ORF comp23557_c0_seq1/g.39786 comp23557_c0_seq1/m.39786 type:complete len:495 (-) comp23557_c0_seq1:405-1889(-)
MEVRHIDDDASSMAMKQKDGASTTLPDSGTLAVGAEAAAESGTAPPPVNKYFTKRNVTQIIIIGTGFLADAYDLFVINNVLAIMAKIYPQTTFDKSLVGSAAVWGAVIGQLFFGGFADYIGRRIIFITTCVLIIVGALASSAVVNTPAFSIYYQLAIFRLIIGIGVGGEYPLAATIAAEATTTRVRGKVMASVFAMQGFGKLTAALVVVILLQAGCPYEVAWRFALAFGAFPAACVFYFRVKLHETDDFKDAKEVRVSHWGNVKSAIRVFWKEMIGTAAAWFFLDIAFYGNGLFNTIITSMMGLGNTVEDKALNSLYVVLMAVPGYWFSVAFLDILGRWNIQFYGFCMLTAIYCCLGGFFLNLKEIPALFIILYGLTYFFGNFGPNATTYVIPGEFFPTQVKATCHGFAAAMGKVGAGIAGLTYPIVSDKYGLRAVMFFSASAMAAGAISTFLVPKYTAEQLDAMKAEHMSHFEQLLKESEFSNENDSPTTSKK